MIHHPFGCSAFLQKSSLFSPPRLRSAASRGEGGWGVRGKKSAISSMFLCTNPKDLAMLNTLQLGSPLWLPLHLYAYTTGGCCVTAFSVAFADAEPKPLIRGWRCKNIKGKARKRSMFETKKKEEEAKNKEEKL